MRLLQILKKDSRKSIYLGLLFSILIFSVLFASNLFETNNDALFIGSSEKFDKFAENKDLKLSADPIKLNLTDVSQNATIVRRVFQSVNFTINATGFADPKYDYNYTQIRFSFESDPHNMTGPSQVGHNWSYVYTPAYNAPLGFHEVWFIIRNKTGTILNTQTTHVNFTIIPNVVVNLNKYLYKLGEKIYGDLIVYDPDLLNWTVSISTGTNPATETILFDEGSNIFSFAIDLDGRFTFNTKYYVKVNITDKVVIHHTHRYFEFFIQNSAPSINQSSIIVSPNTVKRSENVTIRFNADDVETLAELNASIIIEDSEGSLVATYKNEQIIDYDNGTFEKTFLIANNRPLGQYRVNITVFDPQLSEDSAFAYFMVTNNAPEILNYTINDMNNNESIIVAYGEDLVFKFNITDEENTIDYISVAMINEDNEWFNVSKKYTTVNFSITIRTIDLKIGLWYVYVFATDVDGATVGLASDLNIAPQEIRIEPNFFDEFYPWLTFLIGLAIGGAFASVILLSFTSRKKRKIPTTPREPPAELKEKKAKKEKDEGKKKHKILKKEGKAKKTKVKETKEPIEKEKSREKAKAEEPREEKEEPKKKESKSEITRRKIKRKLK